jgi:ADP-ribosylglycohydrolase
MLTGALGDVWGVPPEMRTQAFIKENYGVIQGFLPTKDNRFFHKAGFE